MAQLQGCGGSIMGIWLLNYRDLWLNYMGEVAQLQYWDVVAQ